MVKFKDFVISNPKIKLEKEKEHEFVEMADIISGNKFVRAPIKKRVKGGGSKFQNGDVLFARITPCLEHGKIAQFNSNNVDPAFGSTEFFVFRNIKEVSNKDFIYYLCLTPMIRKPAEKSMTGASGRQRAKIESIWGVEINDPGLENQKKIATVLSNYDNLLENNEKRINLLEQTAKLIYEEWFINLKFPGHKKAKMIDSKTDFGMIPDGWKVKKLGDKIKIPKGKNITKSTVSIGNVPVVAAGLNPACYHNQSNASAPIFTISASGANAGFIRLYYEDIWASDCSYINKDVTPFVYYYYSLIKNRSREITALQRGSAQPHVYPIDIMRLEVVDPTENLIIQFEEISKSIFLEIRSLSLKNKNLRKTRDFLLPKLISGEVDVSDLDIKLSEEVANT